MNSPIVKNRSILAAAILRAVTSNRGSHLLYGERSELTFMTSPHTAKSATACWMVFGPRYTPRSAAIVQMAEAVANIHPNAKQSTALIFHIIAGQPPFRVVRDGTRTLTTGSAGVWRSPYHIDRTPFTSSTCGSAKS
jgi:hypothetical protein